MKKRIINRTNVTKTIRYLQKNGIKHAFYAAKERLEEAGGNDYCYISPDKETLEAQRRASVGLPYRFSIVVPAYETKEEYLREMLDSVMSILMNGSPFTKSAPLWNVPSTTLRPTCVSQAVRPGTTPPPRQMYSLPALPARSRWSLHTAWVAHNISGAWNR